MNQDCPEYLRKITDVMKNGMTIAMSIWSSGNLDWLQHGRCQGSCGQPDLKFKNFKFTTKNANNDDSDNSDDNDNNSDDDEPLGNPLEGFKTEAPASMGRAQPRYTKEGKIKILDEALDYDAISGKQCKNRAKAFDKYCHDLKGKGQQRFRDYRSSAGCAQDNVFEKFHCLAQQCAFEYCLSERDSYINEC